MRRLATGILGCALAFSIAFTAGAASQARDHAVVARNVLPPGETGGVVFDAHATDQLKIYDALTPLFDKVTPADVSRLFKAETLWTGTERAVHVERPRAGVVIKRDTWNVPHIFGKTQADVSYGLGWASAEDRGLLMELARGPARISAIDAPNLDAFGLALSGRQFVSSPQTEAFLAAQLKALSPRELANVRAFVAGVNAQRQATKTPGIAPWTPNDVVAMATLIGARFGAGGGDEVRRAMFLDALRKGLGEPKAHDVWNDLREKDDAETPVTVPGTFAWGAEQASEAGNAVLDDGSFRPVTSAGLPAQARRPERMSNALLVSGKRSSTGHPLMVAGPQVGYFYPEFFFEADLHGGGFDVRGVVLPGLPYVLLGRGPDYAWSATSSNSDNIDTFAEALCGDDLHYLFRGECRAMTTFDGGALRSPAGEQKLVFHTTVHGPVYGYATVGGKRVALALQRSTRGRELRSSRALYALDTGAIRSARDFVRAMSPFEFSFNWFYVDSRDLATFSSGRLPTRAPGVETGLPTIGTGDFEWRGFVPGAKHPQAVDPPSGAIVNWNNKPGLGWAASDDNWAYGAHQRVELLDRGVAARQVHSPATLVGAMNAAATQDIRAIESLPTIAAVLNGSSAPSPRAQRMLDLLEAWAAAGGSRLDRNLDGKIDDPGVAIMDAVWPGWADAVVTPVLGKALADRLAQFVPRFSLDMYDGWMNYVDKDLRTLLGRPVKSPYRVRYCGGGDLAACRTSLWAALDAAGTSLAAAQGADPAAWRADATRERIGFAPGLLPDTMRWTNRPTFQQVISFATHR